MDDVLRYVTPGTDEYLTEKYAAEIAALLRGWSNELRSKPHSLEGLAELLDPSLKAAPLTPADDRKLRPGNGIEVYRRKFPSGTVVDREQFLEQVRTYLAPLGKLETAEFQIFETEQMANSPLRVRVRIRYDLVGVSDKTLREERIGCWLTEWIRKDAPSPLEDKRTFTVTYADQRLWWLDADITVTAREDVTIKSAKHSFFALRLGRGNRHQRLRQLWRGRGRLRQRRLR